MAESTIISGTNAADSLQFTGTTQTNEVGWMFESVVVNANDGNDTVSGYLYDSMQGLTVNGGNDNDAIIIHNQHRDIETGATLRGDVIVNGKINGDSGNDRVYIDDHLKNFTIDGGDGNDHISISDPYYADTITSHTNVDAQIFGDAGDDTIEATGVKNLTVKGGEGDDSIVGIRVSGLILYGDAGNDNINIDDDNGNFSDTKNVKVYGEDGEDTINVGMSRNVTVHGGNDNDSIAIHGKGYYYLDEVPVYTQNGKFYGDAGNDTISYVNAKDITIDGGEGNDVVYEMAGNTSRYKSENVVILGGEGDDLFFPSVSGSALTEYLTIVGGKGNDTIYNPSINYKDEIIGHSVIKYAKGDGDDVVYVDDSQPFYLDLQITSGEIESIYADNGDVVVKVGEGSVRFVAPDVHIEAFGTRDYGDLTDSIITITAASGKDSTYGGLIESSEDNASIDGLSFWHRISTSGNNVTVTTHTGNNQFTLGGSNSFIYACDGNETFSISGANNLVYAEEGNDTIKISGNANSIYGGAGNNNIRVSGSNNSIYGGTGKDYVNVVSGSNNLVDTGAGNDGITVDDTSLTSNLTIHGGKGDDGISLSDKGNAPNAIIFYAEGDGNDKILNFDGRNNYIYLSSGSVSSVLSGDTMSMTLLMSDGATIKVYFAPANGAYYGFGGRSKVNIVYPDGTLDVFEGFTRKDGTGYHTQNTYPNQFDLSGINTDIFPTEIEKNIPDGVLIEGSTLIVTSDTSETAIYLNEIDDGENVQVIDASAAHGGKILMGNALNNSIKSGGNSSLCGGGAGDNTLTGGDSRDQFWYGGGSKDIVTNFVTSGDNSDVIVLLGGELSNIKREGSTVAINLTDGNYIQLQTDSDSDDSEIIYSADKNNFGVAKISSSDTLNYAPNVNYFQLEQAGSIIVSGEGNNIWLNGNAGQYFVNVSTINAAGSTGENTLTGNGSTSNVIYGGEGQNSLWGGGNSADTLIGGGQTMFWYGKNDGNDVIEKVSENDVINLYDFNFEDIIATEVEDSKISLDFNNESKFVVNDNGVMPTFQFADNSRYKYDKGGGQWLEIQE